MIRGIHHVALNTANFEAMLAFYSDVLGFEEVQRSAWQNQPVIDAIIGLEGSAARQAMLRTGTCYLELFEYTAPAPRAGEPLRPCDRGYTHFCIDVIGIDAELARLEAAGMRFFAKAADFGEMKAVYGRDPDGNIIEVIEVDPAHPTALEHVPSLAVAG